MSATVFCTATLVDAFVIGEGLVSTGIIRGGTKESVLQSLGTATRADVIIGVDGL